MVDEEENARVYKAVSKDEIYNVLTSFRKDRIPDQDSWTTDFFLEFFDLLGDDLVRVVEKVRLLGKMPLNINSTFIALIPSMDCLESFEGLDLSLFAVVFTR